MKKNMGATDRIIRFFIAVAIVVLYFTHIISGTVGVILLAAAVPLVVTSLVGICPFYYPFGIRTCDEKKSPHMRH